MGKEFDRVAYGDKAPRPEAPDGRGPSLELKDPALFNNLDSNWKSGRRPIGTPGRANATVDFGQA